MTTVLPVIRAPDDGPPASANGKLNGEITAHTPWGRITETLVSPSESELSGVMNPLCSVIWRA